MKAYVSIFPSGRVIGSLPNGTVIVADNEDALLARLAHAGARELAATEYRWKEALFAPLEDHDQGGEQVSRPRNTDAQLRAVLLHLHEQSSPVQLSGGDVEFTQRITGIARELGIPYTT